MKECTQCHRIYQNNTASCPECRINLTMIPEGWINLSTPSVSVSRVNVNGGSGTAALPNHMLISSPALTINRNRPETVGHEQVVYRQPKRPRRTAPDTQPIPQTNNTASSTQSAAQLRTTASAVGERHTRSDVSTVASRRAALENFGSENARTDFSSENASEPTFGASRRREDYSGSVDAAPTFRANRQRNSNPSNAETAPTFSANPNQRTSASPLFSGTTNSRSNFGRRPVGNPIRNAFFSNFEQILRFIIPLGVIAAAIFMIVNNWEGIKEMFAIFATFWIIGFVITFGFSHRFVSADAVLALSTVISVILIVLYYNIAGIGTGVAAVISPLIPIILIIAAICFILRFIVFVR